MNCKECEKIALNAILEELAGQTTAEFFNHIDKCESCRSMHDNLKQIIVAVNESPMILPTHEESEALQKALQEVIPVKRQETESILPKELSTLVIGSLFAFFTVATILILQALKKIDIVGELLQIGAVPLAIIVIVTVLVTSLLPITITAQRKLHNGMTFKK